MGTRAPTGTNSKFFFAQGFYSAAYCAFFSFIALFMSSKGYNAEKIGYALTAMALTNFIAQPVTGFLCDTKIKQKKLFLICIGASVPFSFLMLFTYKNYFAVIVSIILMTLCLYQMSGIIDSWTMKMTMHYSNINYGVTRSGGTILYYLSALILGEVFSKFGLSLMFYICAAFCIVLFADGMTLPDAPARASSEKSNLKADASLLLHNKPYFFCVLGALLFFLTVGNFNMLAAISVKEFGGDPAQFGKVLFFGIFTETPVLIFAQRLFRNAKSGVVLSLGLFVYCIRLFLLYCATSVTMLYVSQLFHGLGFALFAYAMIMFLNEIVPFNLKATGITLYSAIGSGLGSIIGNSAGGVIAGRFGVRYAYLFNFSLCLLAFVILTIFFINYYRQKALQSSSDAVSR